MEWDTPVLAFADDIIIVGENIDTIEKNTEALLDASKEVGPEKTKYMLMSRNQKIGQKLGIKIANRSFEDVAKFKYSGTTLTDTNFIHKEIKSRLVQGMLATIWFSILSSCSLFVNIEVKIYKTIILPVVWYECETWSFTLMEEHNLGVFENRVLRRMFVPKRDEVMGEWRKFHSGENGWTGHMAHVGEERKV
jgi:hypothetical protein